MSLANDMAIRSQSLGETLIGNLLLHYSNGVFTSDVMDTYPVHTTSPAALMATLAKYTKAYELRTKYLQLITEIVNTDITANTNAAGLFLDVGIFNDLSAIRSVSSIGWILNTLPDSVFPTGTWSRWLSICKANCDYMDVSVQDTTYYINGNFNCNMWTMYLLTSIACTNAADKARYEDMFNRSYAFTLNPVLTAPKWAGYGLIIDAAGVQSDWSDYQAHLSETPGYVGTNPSATLDWDYSTLALDILSRLYVKTRDIRIMRLINAISNIVEPRINTTTWIMDGSGGSRQNNPQAIWTGYYPVTALIGTKASNRALLDDTHIKQMWDQSTVSSMTQNSTNGLYQEGIFQQLDLAIASVREASEMANGLLPVSYQAAPNRGGIRRKWN